MNRFCHLLFFFFFTVSNSYAQEYEPVRMELPARVDSKSYGLELMNEKGLLLFYEGQNSDENNKRGWYFSKLDTNLVEQWVRVVSLSEGMRIHKILSSSERIIVLFLNNTGRKQDPIPYELVVYNIHNEKFSLLGGDFPAQAEVNTIAAIDDRLLIGINLSDNLADLLFFNLSEGDLNTLEFLSDGHYIIQEIIPLEEEEKFGVFIKSFGDKRFESDIFLMLSSEGKLLNRYEVTDEQFRYLASVGMFSSDNEIIAVGSYEHEKSKPQTLKNAKEAFGREAAGLFFLQLKPNGQTNIKYHPFSSLPNIDIAMASDDLMRFRQQQARGKESLEESDIAFQFYKPQIIKQDSLFIFSAEAFRPRYRVESRIDYDFYGRPIPYTYTIFEGYQFFNSILVSFDRFGDVNWLNTFQIRDLISFELDQHVFVSVVEKEVLAAAYYNGLLQSKLFDMGGSVVGDAVKTSLDLRFSNDRLLEEKFGKLNHWYSNYFIVTANQKISNSRLVRDNPRSVFFLQKVAFE